MKKLPTSKASKKSPTPSWSDDFDVQAIRRGTTLEERNFMIDDPRFSEAAMQKRSDRRLAISRQRNMKEILDKFGK